MDISADDLSRQHGYHGQFTVTIDNSVAVIKMALDQNRINVHFIEELHKALDLVLESPDVKVLILIGNGRFFCYGLDLDWLVHMNNKVTNFTLKFRDTLLAPLWKRIFTFPIPTIAAINGHAFGGGAMLALLCDYRTMGTDKGWYSLNEVKIGMAFQPFTRDVVLKYRIPRGHNLTEAAVLGSKYTGSEALAAGIVQLVATNQQLWTSTQNFAHSLVNKTGTIKRESMRTMKYDLYMADFERQQAKL